MSNIPSEVLTELTGLFVEKDMPVTVTTVTDKVIVIEYTPTDNPAFKAITSAPYDPRLMYGTYSVNVLLPQALKKDSAYIKFDVSENTGEHLLALKNQKLVLHDELAED